MRVMLFKPIVAFDRRPEAVRHHAPRGLTISNFFLPFQLPLHLPLYNPSSSAISPISIPVNSAATEHPTVTQI